MDRESSSVECNVTSFGSWRKRRHRESFTPAGSMDTCAGRLLIDALEAPCLNTVSTQGLCEVISQMMTGAARPLCKIKVPTLFPLLCALV